MQAISELLDSLGMTPAEVAATLAAIGVKGLRDSPSFNPLVRCLNRKLDIGGRLEIGTEGTILRIYRERKVTEVVLPAPVQTFLHEFHDGRHPDLETP